MRKQTFRYKNILGILLSAVLALTPASAVWADQVVIEPLNQETLQDTGESQAEPGQNQAMETTQAQENLGGPGVQPTTGVQETTAAGETTAETPTIAEPVIAAEGAALYNADTKTFLYLKNGDTAYYPASITKLMTALLTAENCSLDDTVTFSAAATTNLESGAVSLNMTEGDQLTVRQCLYGLLLKSANEIGNALAEHIGGSNAGFAEKMNAKAAELGCTNTHFTNPHGLNDSNHYTTPHDMALIGAAALQNPTVSTVASTLTYDFPATIKNKARTLTMGHKMLNPSDSRYYPGIIGGKTGYTSKAGNTLVTGVQKDGVTLIAVVMKSKSTHYTDTKALLDYGFSVIEAQKTAQ